MENRDKLIHFVKEYHYGQKRKYTNEPYFNHLISVAEMAEKTGVSYGYEIGLCHDILEDTKCTKLTLTSNLIMSGYSGYVSGKIVTSVIELTDVFTSEAFPYLNRKLRKQCEALRLHSISRQSQIVKCCDLIDNTSSIIEHDPGFASKYIPEIREILKGFTKIDGKIKTDVWNCLLDAEIKLQEF